jgi:hypothetical protein
VRCSPPPEDEGLREFPVRAGKEGPRKKSGELNSFPLSLFLAHKPFRKFFASTGQGNLWVGKRGRGFFIFKLNKKINLDKNLIVCYNWKW